MMVLLKNKSTSLYMTFVFTEIVFEYNLLVLKLILSVYMYLFLYMYHI